MSAPATADGLLHVGPYQTLFAGALGHIGVHQYGAPVFLAGLYGDFRLRIGTGNWVWCRAAVIPAGVRHELDAGGEVLSAVCWEPQVAGMTALARLVRDKTEYRQGLIGAAGEVGALRALYEDAASRDWAEEALGDLVSRRGAPVTDPRIIRALENLQAHPQELAPAALVASRHQLSMGRFLHLFSAQVGVSYRHYRVWSRARAAVGAVIAGSNLTDAALAAGFSDSAHFNHQFRAIFGVPPSCMLNRVARASSALGPTGFAAATPTFQRGRFAERNRKA